MLGMEARSARIPAGSLVVSESSGAAFVGFMQHLLMRADESAEISGKGRYYTSAAWNMTLPLSGDAVNVITRAVHEVPSFPGAKLPPPR